jgi:hypothetical protein
MKIAITSPNAKTISGHAGKCLGYLIYEIADSQYVKKSNIKYNKSSVVETH